MAGDVIAVIDAAGHLDHDTARRVHLVGHSLGGAVVSAAGAAIPVASVVDIDQSLQLAAFKEQLVAAEAALRDPDEFGFVIEAMFQAMSGPLLSDAEGVRVRANRRPDHAVVLGVWELLLTSPESDIAAAVDAALAGYIAHPTPYLALFGIDPGAGYAEWLAERVPGASVETWADHGHYPAPGRPRSVRRPAAGVLGRLDRWLSPTIRRRPPTIWAAALRRPPSEASDAGRWPWPSLGGGSDAVRTSRPARVAADIPVPDDRGAAARRVDGRRPGSDRSPLGAPASSDAGARGRDEPRQRRRGGRARRRHHRQRPTGHRHGPARHGRAPSG